MLHKHKSNLNVEEQCYTNTNSSLNSITNPAVIDNKNSHIVCFLPGANKETDTRTSAKLSHA